MSAPEKTVVTPEGKRVLAQDLPQYEQSAYIGRTRKYRREKKEFEKKSAQYKKELAEYEKERTEFEKAKKAAEKKHQKELAEFEKKFKEEHGQSYEDYQRKLKKHESLKEEQASSVSELEKQKKKEMADVPWYYTEKKYVDPKDDFGGTGGWKTFRRKYTRDQRKLLQNKIGREFNQKIQKVSSTYRPKIQMAKFRTLYPNVTLGGTWYHDWKKYVNLKGANYGTLTESYEKELSRRKGQTARSRELSIKKMQEEAQKMSAQYQKDVTAYANQAGAIKSKAEQIKAPDPLSVKKVRKDILPGEIVKDTKQRYSSPGALIMQRPTKEFEERASAIKSTPNVIVGKTAKLTRPRLTGVKTGTYISGDYFLEDNPTARIAAMFKQKGVTPSGKITFEPSTATGKPEYRYKGKTIREPSASALLDFQLQLKTQTAPSPSIYRGILKEKGLPVTPLAQDIIETYSARPATKKGIKAARGPKPTYTDPITGESFSAETLQGSKKIAKTIGYKIEEPTKQYRFQGMTISDPSAVTLLEFQSRIKTPTLLSPSIYRGILEEKGLPYTPQAKQVVQAFSSDQPVNETSIAMGKKPVITDPKTGNRFDTEKMKGSRKIAMGLGVAVDERPLSSTGQRFEFYLGEIEKQQRKYAKYGDEPGQLLHYGLEFPKDILAGGAYLENIMRGGGAFITGKPSPTRPIQIPETSFGVFTGELIKTKQPIAAGFAVKRYEQEFGRGSSAGAIAAVAVPVPFGEKIGAVGRATKKFGEKIDDTFKLGEKYDYILRRKTLVDPKTGAYKPTRQEVRVRKKAFEGLSETQKKQRMANIEWQKSRVTGPQKMRLEKEKPFMIKPYHPYTSSTPITRSPPITTEPLQLGLGIGTRITPKGIVDAQGPSKQGKIYPDIKQQRQLTKDLISKPDVGQIPAPPRFQDPPTRPTAPKPFTEQAPKRPQQLLLEKTKPQITDTQKKPATTPRDRDILFYPRPKGKIKSSRTVTEYETLRYPPLSKPPKTLQRPELIQKTLPKLGTILLTSELLNIKQVPITAVSERTKQRGLEITKLVELQRARSDLVQKKKEKEEQRGRLVVRETEIITPKLRVGTATIPKLKAPTLQVFAQSSDAPEPLRMLVPETPRPRRGDSTGRRRRVPVFKFKEPETKERKKDEGGPLFGFLGNVPEGQVSGVFKRQELTYGTKKISGLLRGDVRVTKGLKRGTKRKTPQWYEGKPSDPFGFKNETKKIQKRAKKKGVSFW